MSIGEFLTQATDKKEYADILHRKGFSVNMRLYNNNPQYRELILRIIDHLTSLLNRQYNNFSPIGISGANIGVPFNIIAFKAFSDNIIMINPKIIKESSVTRSSYSGCGSIPKHHNNPLKISRPIWIEVEYFDLEGKKQKKRFNNYSSTICHEIDHNKGILITDRVKENRE